MKIDNIHLAHLRNDEHFQFQTEFRDLVNKFNAEELSVRPQFSAYLPLYAQEDEAFKKIVKSAITAEIQEADKRRDLLFRGMIDANKSTLNHFQKEKQDAAKRLKVLFDTYGNVAQKPLNEETSALYNLLQDLRGKYADDAEKTHLDEWADELETANKDFDRLVKDRYEESAEKTDLVLKQVRAQVDDAYRTITDRIDALVIVEGQDKYEGFIKNLNVVIDKYKNTIAQRAGRKKSTGAEL